MRDPGRGVRLRNLQRRDLTLVLEHVRGVTVLMTFRSLTSQRSLQPHKLQSQPRVRAGLELQRAAGPGRWLLCVGSLGSGLLGWIAGEDAHRSASHRAADREERADAQGAHHHPEHDQQEQADEKARHRLGHGCVER